VDAGALDRFVNACIKRIDEVLVPMYQVCRLLRHLSRMRDLPHTSRVIQAIADTLRGNRSGTCGTWIERYGVGCVRLYKYMLEYSPQYDDAIIDLHLNLSGKVFSEDSIMLGSKLVYALTYIVETTKTTAKLKRVDVLYLDIMVKQFVRIHRKGSRTRMRDSLDFLVALAELNFKDRVEGKKIPVDPEVQTFLEYNLADYSEGLHLMCQQPYYEANIKNLTDADEEIQFQYQDTVKDYILPSLWVFAVFDYISPLIDYFIKSPDFLTMDRSGEDFRKLVTVVYWYVNEKGNYNSVTPALMKIVNQHKQKAFIKSLLPQNNPRRKTVQKTLLNEAQEAGWKAQVDYMEFPYLIDVAYRDGKEKTACLILNSSHYLIWQELLNVDTYLAQRQLIALGWKVRLIDEYDYSWEIV